MLRSKSDVLRYQDVPGVLLSIGGMVTAQEFSQIMLEPVFAIPNAARRLPSPQNRFPMNVADSLKAGPHA